MRRLRELIASVLSNPKDAFGWSDAVVGLGIGIPAAECAHVIPVRSA